MALAGGDADSHTGSYCGRTKAAGFALVCQSTSPLSAWNDVQSDLTWSTFSSTDPAPSDTVTAWYLDQEEGLPAVPTLSAFTCAACDAVDAEYTKIWGAGCARYAYFRKAVTSPCPGTTTTGPTTAASACTVEQAAQQHWVTCTFSSDNSVTAFSVNGEDVYMSLPTSCRTNWRQPCTVTFADTSFAAPQVLAFSGADADVHTGSYCGSTRAAGVAFMCESTSPLSAWNAVQSDWTWSTFSSTAQTDTPGSWTGTWAPSVPTASAFTCAQCDVEGRQWLKMWAAGCAQYGHFRKTVTSHC